jgi:hypothetical protein
MRGAGICLRVALAIFGVGTLGFQAAGANNCSKAKKLLGQGQPWGALECLRNSPDTSSCRGLLLDLRRTCAWQLLPSPAALQQEDLERLEEKAEAALVIDPVNDSARAVLNAIHARRELHSAQVQDVGDATASAALADESRRQPALLADTLRTQATLPSYARACSWLARALLLQTHGDSDDAASQCVSLALAALQRAIPDSLRGQGIGAVTPIS